MIASDTHTTLEVVTRFESNFNQPDPDLLMADMTEDAVFEHVSADGVGLGRFEGHDSVRDVFATFPEHYPNFELELVQVIADGDRASAEWIARWDLSDGSRGELPGADFFRMRGDKICEKRCYMTIG